MRGKRTRRLRRQIRTRQLHRLHISRLRSHRHLQTRHPTRERAITVPMREKHLALAHYTPNPHQVDMPIMIEVRRRNRRTRRGNRLACGKTPIAFAQQKCVVEAVAVAP